MVTRIDSGYEPVKGCLEDRFLEIKRLLAQELSINEIADKMGVQRKYVYQFINKRGWQSFVQPGKRKAEWRKACEDVANGKKPKEETSSTDATNNLIEAFAYNIWHEMKEQGFVVDRNDISSLLHESFTHAMNTYKKDSPASFRTYFTTIVRQDVIDYKKSLGRALKRQGFENVGQNRREQLRAELV